MPAVVHHVIMAADDNYAQHLGVCLVSLFENNKQLSFEVSIFENKISKDNKTKIIEVARNYNQSVRFVSLCIKDFSDFPITAYYSPVTYFRLRLAEYISEDIERVLYLDCDTIVCNDIRPLLDIDLKGFPLAAVLDTPWQVNFASDILGIPLSSGYFNAGVLMIDMKAFRAVDVFKQAHTILKEYEQLPFLDQDILNIIFCDKWMRLPCKWNLLNGFFRRVYQDSSDRAIEMKEGIYSRCIVHYSAAEKPWTSNCVHPLISQYYHYLAFSPWKDFRVNKRIRHQLLLFRERCEELFKHGKFIRV